MQAISTGQAPTAGQPANARSVMKYRFMAVGAALTVAAGSLALLAAPASAADGPPMVGCTTGSSCMVELNYSVTYSGSTGGHNGVVVPPPPCIGVPFGDAHTGSAKIISLYSNTAPVTQPSSGSPGPTGGGASPSSTDSAAPTDSATPAGSSPTTSMSATSTSTASTTALVVSDQQGILNQAEGLVNSNPITPGEWYQIYGNPYATATQQQKCTSLPPFVWVPQGQTVPVLKGLHIPVRTLAKLAFSQLTTAQLGTVTVNPTGQSDTNLPTFVDVVLNRPASGALSVTTDGIPYVWATAETPDGTSATVWAKVTGLSINPGTANATAFHDQRCSQAQLNADGLYQLGSRYSASEMAKVGAGQKIDCGVTYSAPGTYGMTVSVSWKACWMPGTVNKYPDGPPANCQAVPGAGGLADSMSAPQQVTVREIQSVNNG
jgi:hypothetical protein